jgi:hypothetical protein
MVKTEGVAAADSYLRRLLQVAAKQHTLLESAGQINKEWLSLGKESSCSSASSHSGNKGMVDIVSVATVMQGWANNGDAEKAQEWLDCLLKDTVAKNGTKNALSTLNIGPNTLAYTFVIQAWAQQGHAHKAQTVLETQLDAYWKCGIDDKALRPDRILFHAVLDAWSKVCVPVERDKVAPMSAKALVHLMEDVASKMVQRGSRGDAEKVRPNIETFGKLIAIVTRSNTRKYGPKQAERLLLEVEESFEEIAPVVVVNRILQGYTDCARMEEAQAFLKRRFEQLEPLCSRLPKACHPDVVTLNLLLKGFAKMAKKNPEAPQHARETLDRFATEFGIRPNMQSYSIILNSWSNCSSEREDAAEQAEDLLRSEVVDLYHAHGGDDRSFSSGKHNRNSHVDDFTICINIVLKTWSFQARHSHQTTKDKVKSWQAVERALNLLAEFLETPDAALNIDSFGKNAGRKYTLKEVTANPSDGTFRAVLHAILDSSISQKHKWTEVIIGLMKRHGYRPNKSDLKRMERLSSIQAQTKAHG